MNCLLMNTGREHDLHALQHPDNLPSIQEIAYSLAHINRYTGHAFRAYSVAEHSLLTAEIARDFGTTPLGELCALMHDAHECITGDVSSPVKDELGEAWHVFERKHQRNLLVPYGLYEAMLSHVKLVKFCDLTALATERRDLMLYSPTTHAPWPVIDTPGRVIHPWEKTHLMEDNRLVRRERAWTTAFTVRAYALFEQCGIALP